MAQDIHTLYAVSINGTVIDQVQDQSLDSNIQEIKMGSDGQVDPTYAAVMQHDPVFSFTTSQVATLLGVVGIDALAIAADVVLYWQKTTEQGIRAGASSHVSATIAKGLVVPRRISAAQGGHAVMSFDVIAVSSDGLTAPIAFATGISLPAGGGVSELYTVGPLNINGAAHDGVQSFEFDFGLDVQIMRHSGQVYPLRTHIAQRNPTLTFQSSDAVAINTLGLSGVEQGASDSVAYLRKIDRNGTRVANNVAEHISFSIDDGRWAVRGVSGNHPDPQMSEIACTPISDQSNAIVAIATTAAIA